MKLIKSILVVTIVSFTIPIFAQENQQEYNEQMKLWTEYMSPGNMHKQMAKLAGNWKTTNKMWMNPNSEPSITEGNAVIETLLGGRYFKTTHTGNFMGMPFEGFSIEAYDNALQEFSSIWIDNFGTGMMYLRGKYDEPTKTITYVGASVDPIQKKEMKVKEVFKFVDDNNFSMEMYMLNGDKEVKTMEINYTRSM
ncbi:DUF1579 domain-containing protein [Melioribacteraceae bacterium 4301-Me]|uniref:DUF1579 domain-containing protein n=1 Tax=Pyranulibacter aquaticus TaxID=3163344 RepID=UPI00359B1FC0